jgi:glycosidase
VAAAHARGLRVALDGVFNHVARSFDAPADWFRRGPDGTVDTSKVTSTWSRSTTVSRRSRST